MAKLAIILPTYKIEYLDQTLQSLSKQTCKDFVVYIGDDQSPDNIKQLVDRYMLDLNIIYKKFDTNLGGSSLTRQWERSIELSEEEWIWLFSDDDLMEATCVETFYQTLNKNPKSRLFKFHTKMIDEHNAEIPLFKDRTNLEKIQIEAKDFIVDRLRDNRFRSYAVEYIFHRSIYNENKFVEFPLAWASDDATWLNYSFINQGITIVEDMVYWRFSGKNISSDLKNKLTVSKKTDAAIQYVNWIYRYSNEHHLEIGKSNILYWLFNQYYLLTQNAQKDNFEELVHRLDFHISNDLFKASHMEFKKNIFRRKIKNCIKKWIGRG